MQAKTTSKVHCPSCRSRRVWRDGLRYGIHNDRPIQRYLCRSCGFRFSETTRNSSDDTERVQRVHTKKSYSSSVLSSNRQVCVTETQGAKNLVKVETRTEKRAAGATTKKPTEAEVKGRIIEYLWHLKKQGYKDLTVKQRVWLRKRMLKLGADLFDQESVKKIIAQQSSWDDGTKFLATVAYGDFATMFGIKFEPPTYRQTKKLPFIPTEEEIDQLIAACGKKTATVLQLIKETAMRPGEAWRLEWTDIDVARKIVRISAEKYSNPRILPISNKLISMLNNMPKNSNRIFATSSPKIMRVSFYHQRQRIAKKLGNPRLLKISFCILRHWKATVEYHRTKDILHVMRILGHRSIQNTLIYIDLERAIFATPENEEFSVRVAINIQEACELVEAGFEYVTGEYSDGGKIFRKRK